MSAPVGFVKERPIIWHNVPLDRPLLSGIALFSTNLHFFPDKRQRYSDKYMKHIFFLILTTLALLCCESQQKADKHTLFCYARYDEALKLAKAEANLQDSGSKTSLEIPGGIRYQGMEMKLTPIYGMSYRYEYPAEFLAEQVFDWRDAGNRKQVFRMNTSAVTKFSLKDSAISQTQATALQWEGSPLGKGETMVLMWENAQEGRTLPLEVASTLGTPQIDIPAAKLKDLSPGDWTLYLVRKKLVKDTIAGMPVHGITEFYSKPIDVKVTK